MERRDFLKAGAMLGMGGALPGVVFAQGRGKRNGYGNLLILIELKGGNDGLNTVVPASPARSTTRCARASPSSASRCCSSTIAMACIRPCSR